MRLRKQMQFAVEFTKFCQEMDTDPKDLALMIVETEIAAKCWERNDKEGEIRHSSEVERLAERNALTVDWPGLYPCVQKTGKPETNRMLPMPD